MKLFKKWLIKILYPPTMVVVLSVPLTTAMLIYVFVTQKTAEPIAGVIYFFSAYVLIAVCVRMPALYNNIKGYLKNNRFVKRYITDVHWRVRLSLLGSVSLNILYVLMMLASGILYRANWFYALATYYTLLIIMRLFLLRDTSRAVPGKNRLKEFYRYRFCGVLMLIMNQALTVIVTYIVYQNRGFEYSQLHTITMSVYTFAAMTVAIVNVIRYRRYESPLMSAAKAISLVSAMVSMLSLETAMLVAFGKQENPEFRRNLTAITGFVVCIFVFGIAIYMIVHANKQIKILKQGEKRNGK